MITLPRIHGARPIRHHVSVVCAALSFLSAAALPTAADAQTQRCQAPPGRSGVEQYCEALPLAGGPQGGGRDGSNGVDRGTANRLRSAGREGAAVLALSGGARGGGAGADQSGSGTSASGGSASGGSSSGGSGSGSSDSTRGDGGGSASSGGGATAADEPSGNVLSALGSSVEDGPTLSDGFVWLLVAIALGCFALAWVGWRRGRSGPSDLDGSAS